MVSYRLAWYAASRSHTHTHLHIQLLSILQLCLDWLGKPIDLFHSWICAWIWIWLPLPTSNESWWMMLLAFYYSLSEVLNWQWKWFRCFYNGTRMRLGNITQISQSIRYAFFLFSLSNVAICFPFILLSVCLCVCHIFESVYILSLKLAFFFWFSIDLLNGLICRSILTSNRCVKLTRIDYVIWVSIECLELGY